jgi:hypothetical protein
MRNVPVNYFAFRRRQIADSQQQFQTGLVVTRPAFTNHLAEPVSPSRCA